MPHFLVIHEFHSDVIRSILFRYRCTNYAKGVGRVRTKLQKGNLKYHQELVIDDIVFCHCDVDKNKQSLIGQRN